MTGKLDKQASHNYGGYRVYITADAYVMTYRDADLLRVERRHHDHAPGFVLLLVKLIFLALVGKRTELRDKWATAEKDHEADAHNLNVELLKTHGDVLEFTVEHDRVKNAG